MLFYWTWRMIKASHTLENERVGKYMCCTRGKLLELLWGVDELLVSRTTKSPKPLHAKIPPFTSIWKKIVCFLTTLQSESSCCDGSNSSKGIKIGNVERRSGRTPSQKLGKCGALNSFEPVFPGTLIWHDATCVVTREHTARYVCLIQSNRMSICASVRN